MPKIAELKEIDGEIWAKIPLSEYAGVVSLYSEEDIKNLKRQLALAICDRIFEMYPK